MAFVFGCLWASFTVELGSRTLVQHLDRIGQTPEAQELVEGTRSTVDPMLEEAKDRVLGEHVEAPTYIESNGPVELADGKLPAPKPRADPRREEATPARASTASQARLPGRRH